MEGHLNGILNTVDVCLEQNVSPNRMPVLLANGMQLIAHAYQVVKTKENVLRLNSWIIVVVNAVAEASLVV